MSFFKFGEGLICLWYMEEMAREAYEEWQIVESAIDVYTARWNRMPRR